MPLDPSYLEYPERSYGMDHDRYDWSMLSERKPVKWPEGKKLAVWINVCLQFFPLNQQGKPFKVPGGMTMPYPDLRHFSLRDYGNRVGIYRVLQALDRFQLQPTIAMNTRLAERYPYLLNKILARGDEILCHGEHMDALHYGGQDAQQETEQIQNALSRLRELTGQPIRGWLSPAKSESERTPDLLKAQGIDYFCDWVNDDMPYPFRTEQGELIAMPLSTEIDDQFVIQNNLHSEDSYVEQVCDACDFLMSEAEQQGGRILALNIHPWLVGQPHRIGKLESIFEYKPTARHLERRCGRDSRLLAIPAVTRTYQPYSIFYSATYQALDAHRTPGFLPGSTPLMPINAVQALRFSARHAKSSVGL